MKNRWPISYIPYEAFAEANREKAIEDAFRTISKAGYQGVEFPGLYWFKTVDDVKAIMRLAKKYDLKVPETKHCYDFINFDAKERKKYTEGTKTALKLAEGAGIDKVQVFTGPYHGLRLWKDLTEGQAWGFVFDAFDEIVPVAEKLGITITIEPVFDQLVRDYYTMMEFLNHYKSKALAVNYDVGNFNLYKNDLAWTTRRLGSLIKHTHIHDTVGMPGMNMETFTYALIGQGTVDWTAWFQALNEIGYKGYLSIEFRGPWFATMGADFGQEIKMYRTALENRVKMA